MVCFNQLVLGIVLVVVFVLAPGFATGQEAKPVERPRPELPTPPSADTLTRTELIISPNGTIQIVEKGFGDPDAFPPQSAVKPKWDPRQSVNLRPLRPIPAITIDSVLQGLLVLGGFYAVCYLAGILVWAIARPQTPASDVK